MFPTTRHHHNHLRQVAATAAAFVAIVLTAVPSSARQDAGDPGRAGFPTNQGECELARVGSQFVKCDDLTGNGVAAPAWVPER